MTGLPKGAVLATVAFVAAYVYLRWIPASFDGDNLELIESKVLKFWSENIRWPAKNFTRLAVGINADVDVIVSGVDLLTKLGQVPGRQRNHNTLHSVSNLQETFAYFFSRGHAAERVFAEPQIFRDVVKAAFSLSKVERYVGGNAALMAKIAASLFPDVKIQFVGPVGPSLQQLMPKNIDIPSSSLASDDEYHLIMEFKEGQRWGALTAPVATRFICSYDASNSQMSMLETFFASLPQFQPDIVIISGLHMLDGQDAPFFASRLDVLVAGLRQIDVAVPVHLEFASMANQDFIKAILDRVLPEVTSLGLNEQELTFAALAAGGPYGDQAGNEGQPPIHEMSDIILWLLRKYGKSAEKPTSRLTRVHFHSLTYHIVGVHRSHWGNTQSAAMAGTRVAGMQACDVKDPDPDIVDLKIPLEFHLFSGGNKHRFDPDQSPYTWTVDDYYFVFSPVLVCKSPVKTVGLGDAISATGLMFSLFNP